jgi:hypothetical protein
LAQPLTLNVEKLLRLAALRPTFVSTPRLTFIWMEKIGVERLEDIFGHSGGAAGPKTARTDGGRRSQLLPKARVRAVWRAAGPVQAAQR